MFHSFLFVQAIYVYLYGMMTINQQTNQIYTLRVLWSFMETVLTERDLSRVAAYQITTAAVKNKLNHFTNITCAIIRLAQEGSTHNLSQTFQLASR